MKNQVKNSRNFDLVFWMECFNENDEMYLKIPIAVFTLIHKSDLEIDYNHDTDLKLENLIVVLK